jgi:uncharacterized protein
MIVLNQRVDGVCIPVQVQPGARRNAVMGEHGGALKIAVNVPPEQGKANAAVIELLANSLSLSRSHFSLLTGAKGRQKQFLVTGIALADLELKIAALIASAAN